MIGSASAAVALVALLAGSAYAQVNPSTPANTPIGASQTIVWDTDKTGKWTKMDIWLRTGANQAMVDVAPVATGLDGTTVSSFTWTIPAVTPTSAIYFYEFTIGNREEPTWTTRWGILPAGGGALTAPTNARQPDGSAIPWGTGRLVGAAAPPASGSGAAASTNVTSASVLAVASSVVVAAANSTVPSVVTVTPSAPAVAAATGPTTSTSVVVVMASAASGSLSSVAGNGTTTRAGAADALNARGALATAGVALLGAGALFAALA